MGIPDWSAWGDLHSQGCSGLSRTGLLFPANHTPVGDPGLAPGRLGDFKSPGSAVPAEASRREMVGMKGLAPPRLPDSESGPSSIRVEPHARKLVHPAGLPPANSPFEAEDDNRFHHGCGNGLPSRSRQVMKARLRTGVLRRGSLRHPLCSWRRLAGCHGLAPCSVRVRAGASLSKFAARSRHEGGVEPPQPDL